MLASWPAILSFPTTHLRDVIRQGVEEIAIQIQIRELCEATRHILGKLHQAAAVQAQVLHRPCIKPHKDGSQRLKKQSVVRQSTDGHRIETQLHRSIPAGGNTPCGGRLLCIGTHSINPGE